MTTISASFRSVEASITSYQSISQRQSLAVGIRAEQEKPASLLNNQQQQIADEVGISEDALRKFEEAQTLANQLQNYLDYLYGRSNSENVKITAANDNADVTISGRSTELAASITVGRIEEKTLDVTAELDDEGNLESLSITKTQTNIEFISAQVSLSDTQFYARG